MQILIVDLDGTVLNNEKRYMAVLKELNIDVDLEQIRKRKSSREVIGSEKIDDFYQLFLSNKYLYLDEPMKNAASVLKKLNKKFIIFYLTGRHHSAKDSMLNGTVKWLEEHNFPMPGDKNKLLMKPGRKTPDYDFKEGKVAEIKELGDVRAGLGDAPTDAAAYLQNSIKTIIMKSGFRKWDYPEKAVLVSNWKEIGELL